MESHGIQHTRSHFQRSEYLIYTSHHHSSSCPPVVSADTDTGTSSDVASSLRSIQPPSPAYIQGQPSSKPTNHDLPPPYTPTPVFTCPCPCSYAHAHAYTETQVIRDQPYRLIDSEMAMTVTAPQEPAPEPSSTVASTLRLTRPAWLSQERFEDALIKAKENCLTEQCAIKTVVGVLVAGWVASCTYGMEQTKCFTDC